MADPGSLNRPVLADDRRVPDDVLASAYASVSDVERSWIKKNIAQIYALHPPGSRDRTGTQTRWSSGLATTSIRLARPWACLVFPDLAPGLAPEAGSSAENPYSGESLVLPTTLVGAGPAGVAAALVPVMTAGIPDILAILPPSLLQSAYLLTTLELCGLENVYVVSPEALSAQIQTLVERAPAGLILDMGGVVSRYPLAPMAVHRTMTWTPGPRAPLRIWCAADLHWDWWTLEWNHPHTRIEAWGPCRDAAPDQFPRNDGGWDVFRGCSQAVLGVGANMLQAPDRSGLPDDALILTPGQEGCWYWLDLDPDFLCFQHGMTLADIR